MARDVICCFQDKRNKNEQIFKVKEQENVLAFAPRLTHLCHICMLFLIFIRGGSSAVYGMALVLIGTIT